MILETIQTYNDVKKVPMEQMPQLAQEIRDFLIHTPVSYTHLGMRYQTGWRLRRSEVFQLPLLYCSLIMTDAALISWILPVIRISPRILTVR